MNKKPNIIFILTDDQGAWAMHCVQEMGMFIRLIWIGLQLRESDLTIFFLCIPVCSPARASIFTGTIPSCHGGTDWLSGGNLPADLKQIQGHPGYEKETIPLQYTQHLTAYTDLLKEMVIIVLSVENGMGEIA